MSVSLKKRSEDSRPRERLLRNGAASLSTAELLAILIGSGTTQKDAVQLMGEVLEYCGNDLTQLGRITYEELTGFKGIGEAKAITVLAALEFARRRMDASPTKKREFRDSSDLYDFFRPLMCDKDHEVFWVLLLNNRLQYVDDRCLSQGDIKGTVVEPRMVFNYVEKTKASGYFQYRRNEQSKYWMYESINEHLKNNFFYNEKIKQLIPDMERQVLGGQITSFVAANKLLEEYYQLMHNTNKI